MCGIAGILVSPLDQGSLDVALITQTLGVEMETRGKDSTGVARCTASGRIKVTKAARRATEFFAQRPGLAAEAKAVLIHTRAATKGHPTNPMNNHPLVVGPIVGIHNGIIDNDFELYRDNPTWTRQGQVDSEAIFAAIHGLGAKTGLESIEGSAAVAWFNADDPGALWLARGWSSPLHVGISGSGTVIFASTEWAIKKAFRKAEILEFEVCSLAEGTMARFVSLEGGGVDKAVSSFTPKDDPFWLSRGAGTYTSRIATPVSSRSGSAVRDAEWVVGAEGYVLRPGDPVVFVPFSTDYGLIYGDFKQIALRPGMAYVRLDLDEGLDEQILLPVKQLWPVDAAPLLHVGRTEATPAEIAAEEFELFGDPDVAELVTTSMLALPPAPDTQGGES